MHDDGPARGTNRPSEGASTMVRLRLLSVSSAGEAAAVLTADCARGVNPSVTECSADAATNSVANSGAWVQASGSGGALVGPHTITPPATTGARWRTSTTVTTGSGQNGREH